MDEVKKNEEIDVKKLMDEIKKVVADLPETTLNLAFKKLVMVVNGLIK